MIIGICLLVILIIWITTVVFFRPAYYAATQSELSRILSFSTKVIDDSENGLTSREIDKISSYINYGVCIEISDEFGNGLALMEGIGDGCQLHGAAEYSSFGAFYSDQKKLNTVKSLELRRIVRDEGTYTGSLTDEYGNRQLVKGKYLEKGYCVIVSTNLTRVDSVVEIVESQLRMVTIISIILALLLSAVLSNWFIKPIRSLSKATKEIAGGNYDVKLEVPHFSQEDEIGQLAGDFNAMVTEIESSQEMQRELIAGISHDLRTPLTIIKGYAESIRDITGDDPETRRQQLNTIIGETDRLSEMVNSVMEYAKVSRGADKLNIVQYNMADMCEEIVDIYSNRAASENKTITYEGPDTVYVFADASLIERVMHNFVSNALIHTPPGTRVKIKISVLENGKVRVSVADSGEGIDENDKKHIFDRYYRARKESGKPGTGLGLAIVKAILENHKFEYGVESEVGKGAEFWFIM